VSVACHPSISIMKIFKLLPLNNLTSSKRTLIVAEKSKIKNILLLFSNKKKKKNFFFFKSNQNCFFKQ
jgi:hypothetical protein